jgi:hypothetical protein
MATTKEQAMTTTKRAPKGGALGANGEWYEGGKFINTVPENRKREGSAKRGTGKQEIAPYVWEVAPEGKSSIYRRFAGLFGKVINGVGVMTDGGNGDRLPAILKYCGRTREEAQAIIDRWNAGERWM